MLARQIAELSAPRAATPTPGTRGRQRTPTGRDLQAFLETGIAGFAPLAERPLSQPTPLVDETIVPIQALLYSGRAALDRALELRAEIGREGGTPSADTLAELFDLLELATS
jgi:hypothetical protein